MKYYEKKTWLLTSCTTPYTGMKWVELNKRGAMSTALHRVELDVSSVRNVTITAQSHPEESCTICVGYSALSDWEGIALIDTSPFLERRYHQTSSSTLPEAQPSTNNHPPISLDRVSSQITIDETVTSVASHRRNFSGDSGNMMSTENSIIPELGAATSGETTPPATASGQRSDPRNILILREVKDSEEYRCTVNFRPLAPTVAEFPSSQGGLVRGMFVGSSDSNDLSWFVPESNGFASGTLSRIHLVEEVFQFSSCVMAIGFLAAEHDEASTVGITCQDGTMRLISFQYNEIPSESGHFQIISSTSVIIDGPLTCIHLSRGADNKHKHIRVVAGSLCGYAATLLHNNNGESDWQGPHTITQGLLNLAGEEDCVMAVHAFGNYVYLGLLSGRLMVLCNCASNTTSSSSPDYIWKWECQLPHSVHGIATVQSRVDVLPHLLVTTRWSIHLLTPELFSDSDSSPLLSKKPSFFGSSEKNVQKSASYSASLARSRLTEMVLKSKENKGVDTPKKGIPSKPSSPI